MDYNHIKSYLDKFKTIISSKEENTKIISSILEEIILVKIETKFIQVKAPFVYIKATPLIKGEILINKEKIINQILILLPNLNIKDIK